MLPGTLCDGRLFGRQARALRSIADVRRLDYHDMRDARRWVKATLARLPARFSVAGFSLGGLIGLEMLRQAPERIRGIALIASNAEGGNRRIRRRSDRLWKLWRHDGAAAVARQLKPAYFHHRARRSRHAGLIRRMAEAHSAASARAQFRWAATRPDGLQALANAPHPLLVVSGERDRLCTPAVQRRLVQARPAAYPAATWQQLPRCGHFVPLEAPAALTRAMQAWLQAMDQGTGEPM